MPAPPDPRRLARRLQVARGIVYVSALVTLGATLTSPFLGMHSWRQTQNAMVARNFARHGLDPTVTLLDLDGGGLLYGVNLPVLCWPAGLAWRVLGNETPVVPRLLALLATLAAAWLLERLGRRLAGPWTGLIAAVIFLQAPLIAGYGASFLEDAVMLAFIGLAVERAFAWGARPRWSDAGWVCLGIAMTIGIKLPVAAAVLPAVVGVAFAGAMLEGEHRGNRRAAWIVLHPHLLVALGVGLGLGVAYYGALWWRSLTYEHFAWAFTWEPGTDKWGSLAMLAAPDTSILLFKRVVQEVVGLAGLVLVLVALAASTHNPRAFVPVAWLVSVLVYMYISLGGQLAHDYYQLPLVQPLALLGAFCFAAADNPSRLRRALPVVGVLLMLVMAVELQPFRTFLRTWEDPRWSVLAEAVADATRHDEQVLVIDHQRPEVLYYADRRGYHLVPARATAEAITDRVARGVAAIGMLEPQRLPALWDPGLQQTLDGWTVASSGEHHMVLRRPQGSD